MRRLVGISLLALLVAGCGNSTENGIIDFCSSRGGVRGIVNGVTTTDFPSVVSVKTASGGGCTGSVVSDTTVITAAHCVGTGQISYNGLYTSKVVFSKTGLDLAIAVFEPGTFGQSWARLLTRAPVPGETIALIGYGQTDFVNNNQADGQKRIGCNTLRSFANVSGQTIQMQPTGGNYLFYFSPIALPEYGAPGQQSMSGHGDSGGPLFIDGRLIGATNFGDKRSSLRTRYNIIGDTYNGPDVLYEYDTNLFSATSVALLRQAQTQIGAQIPDLDALDAAVRASGTGGYGTPGYGSGYGTGYGGGYGTGYGGGYGNGYGGYYGPYYY